MLFFLIGAFLFAQQDQTPRPLQKDERGLLKIDPVYFDLAANTGGDFYFWAPGEFSASRLQVPVHHEDVLLAYGSIEAKKVFDIPVESGVMELTVFAGIQRKDLAVWHLELHGAGTYAVTAHLKPADGGPHLTRFALNDAPSCEVSYSGSVKDPEVVFVARDGSILATSPIAHCSAPDVPFRAAIRGTDASGAAFQRIESHLHAREKK